MSLDKLKTILGRYKLDELLFLISNQIRLMYNNKKAVVTINLPCFRGNNSILTPKTIAACYLNDIIYYSIFYSNDHRLKTPNDKDLLYIYQIYESIHLKNIDLEYPDFESIESLARFLFGSFQTQLTPQNLLNGKDIKNKLIRQFIQLNEIPDVMNLKISLKNDFQNITGFSIIEYLQLQHVLLAYCINKSSILNISIDPEITIKYPYITDENVKKCYSFLVGDYDFYRKSALGPNSLFVKPIVKTSHNVEIVPNII